MGGTKVAMACPNMWLSGSRFRKRIGWNGRAYLRYFAISRSIGTMLASTLRWVMVTPFGSAVAPDVKMISATSSRATAAAGSGAAASSAAWHASARRQTGVGSPSSGRSTSAPASTAFAPTMPCTRRRKAGDER